MIFYTDICLFLAVKQILSNELTAGVFFLCVNNNKQEHITERHTRTVSPVLNAG